MHTLNLASNQLPTQATSTVKMEPSPNAVASGSSMSELATVTNIQLETVETAKIFGYFVAWITMRLFGRRYSLLMVQKGQPQNLPDSYIKHHLMGLTKMCTLVLLRAPTPPQTLFLALHLLRNLISVPHPLPLRLSTPTRMLLACLMLADSLIGAERGTPMRIWKEIARIGGLVDGIEEIEKQQARTASSTPASTQTSTPVANSPQQPRSNASSTYSPPRSTQLNHSRRRGSKTPDAGMAYLALLKQDALAVLEYNLHPLFLSYGGFLATMKELVDSSPNSTTEQGQGIVAGVPPASLEMKKKMKVILDDLTTDEGSAFGNHFFKGMGKLNMKWRW
ncbi:UNVERIFIED_CONTAM: hypothetical protein HDU68_011102 [Siphonaria sp. JEL0065]|nr:hypothetical protein HDU68_011102 [Siphonaria sp. JEL0065]